MLAKMIKDELLGTEITSRKEYNTLCENCDF